MRTLNPSLALASLVGFLTAASCTLITDVDRTKIPTDAGAEAGSPSTGGTGETSGTGGTAENGGTTQNGGTGGTSAGEAGQPATGGTSGTGGTTSGTGGESGGGTGGTSGSAGAPPVVPVCDHASGSITLAPMTFLADGDTFTLGDGVNAKVVFEFDFNRDGVTDGHTEIDVDASQDQFALASVITDAVNTLGDDTLRVTATFLDAPSSGGGEAGAAGASGDSNGGAGSGTTPPDPAVDTARIALANDAAGALGNVRITKTVGNPGFKVSGMSGGNAVACASAAICTGGDECASGTCGDDKLCE